MINSSSLITVLVDGQPTNISWNDLTAAISTSQSITSIHTLDLFWFIFGGVLVFLMMLGLALLELGCCHKKNTKHILIRILGDCCITGVTFYALGYGFAFMDGNGFIGSSGFFMHSDEFIGTTATQAYNGHRYADWFFQWAIAAVAVNICHGALAERMQIRAYFVYSVCASIFIYPVCAHWVWAETGWASMFNTENLFMDLGVMDFAGTGCLHMFAGTSGLVGAIILGPRLGRFGSKGEVELPQQSVLYQFMGTMFLWFGWYGFNCVSTLGLGGVKADVMAKVAANLTISACTAGVVTVFLDRLLISKTYDITQANNGILAGCVVVTGSCSVIEPECALILGVLGAIVYLSLKKVLAKLHVDDVVDAIPVHCGCGILGTLAPGMFASPKSVKMFYGDAAENCGFFYSCPGGGGKQFGAQIVYAIAIFAFVAACCCVVFGGLKAMGWLRVSVEAEKMGLDEYEHGGSAYNDGNEETGTNNDSYINALESPVVKCT